MEKSKEKSKEVSKEEQYDEKSKDVFSKKKDK